MAPTHGALGQACKSQFHPFSCAPSLRLTSSSLACASFFASLRASPGSQPAHRQLGSTLHAASASRAPSLTLENFPTQENFPRVLHRRILHEKTTFVDSCPFPRRRSWRSRPRSCSSSVRHSCPVPIALPPHRPPSSTPSALTRPSSSCKRSRWGRLQCLLLLRCL